ncbi:MAG: dTDP-glucose 4,6-dehydratase [Candidatus Cloacimonetes bacterium]|nr:dTDP-glucose 4,6-dehydratase [Candidatus Cloacimonadota bacterium]
MKLLVTGGCGFIGSNFILYLFKKYPKYKIINIDSLTYAGNNLKDVHNTKTYQFVKGDICDRDLIRDLVAKSDIVVNFAAESHVDRSIEDSSNSVRTNIVGTHVLLDAVRYYQKKIHHISTDEVFGELGSSGFFDEETPYNPRSPYSASKAGADHLVRAYHNTYGLPITITHCSNNYGPFQHPEKIIPKFIISLLNDQKVQLYGDGSNIRDWIHVSDHCKALDLVIHNGKDGESYCIGGECEKTNKQITKDILRLMDKNDSYIEYVEDRKGHDKRYAIDNTKIRKLGWKPGYIWEKGLSDTIQWYIEKKDWWENLIFK